MNIIISQDGKDLANVVTIPKKDVTIYVNIESGETYINIERAGALVWDSELGEIHVPIKREQRSE